MAIWHFFFGFAGTAEAFGFGDSYSILYGFDDDGRKGIYNTFIDSEGENRVIVDFTVGLGISLLAGEGQD